MRVFWQIFLPLLAAGNAFADGKAPGTVVEDWVFLDNGQLRVGVIKSAGGAIGWLSESGSERNLVNHYDRGRLIQQSYYGDADGSKWVEKPWRLNPVQGGSYRNKVPPLVEIEKGEASLYSRSIPLHWATGEELDDFTFEQWIELEDDLVHIRFRMSYTGDESHAPRHQEIPAVFLDPSLSELVFTGGDVLMRERPGQTNEYLDIPDHWAAFVGADGEGVGVYVPAADRITTYRFQGGADSDCSYLAPIVAFPIEPDLVFEYNAYFFVGTIEQMRERFDALAAP